MSRMHDEVVSLLPFRRGHFQMESGHHSDLWVDLELLCLDPNPVRRLSSEIAARLTKHNPDIICGPLVEGAFVALMVASELGLPFCYSERFQATDSDGLYPVKYCIPAPLREIVRGKRVAVVNDVINAGSAVRGTISDLELCGAQPVALASLLVFGAWATEFAAKRGVAMEALASLPNNLWTPAECPLCKRDIPITTCGSTPPLPPI